MIAIILSGVIVIGRLVIRFGVGGDPWQQGDWLINYSAGYVRRGLVGHIAYLFNQSGIVGLDTLLFVGQTFAFVGFLVAVVYLMLQRVPRYELLLIVISPAFVFFTLWDFQGGLRKDILLLFLFAWLTVWSTRPLVRVLERKIYLGAWIVTPAFLGFNHEGLLFYLPFMYLALWLVGKDRNFAAKKIWGAIIASSLLAAVPFVLSVLYPGTQEQSETICTSLVDAGKRERFCWGAISAIGWSLQRGLDQTASMVSLWYIPAVLLAMIPFVLFRYSKKVLLWAALAAVAVLPLFVLGGDWGRWIHLYVAIASIIVLRGVSTGDIAYRMKSPPKVNSLVATPILLAYSLAWHIPHYSAENLAPGPVRLFQGLFGG